MKRFYETALLLIGTLGWWGFVYPELSAVTGTCVQEETQEEFWQESQEEAMEESWQGEQSMAHKRAEGICSLAEELLRDLGNFGISSGDVRIKSRIAEYLYQEKEKETTEKESGYEEQKRTHRGV